jgi:cell wall-associated NlpC family hydrolase
MTKIITEAREWLHTPFKHQAKLKNIGCDCIGLVAGVLENLGVDIYKYYSSKYSETPDGEMLERELDRAFELVTPHPTLPPQAGGGLIGETSARKHWKEYRGSLQAGEETHKNPSPFLRGEDRWGVLAEGNIFLMKFQNQPQHVGFISVNDGVYSIIHSYKNIGKVVEHRLNQYWASKIIKIYETRI